MLSRDNVRTRRCEELNGSLQCFAIQLAENYGEDSDSATKNWEISSLNRTYCGYFEIIAGRFDVYYWPGLKADTSYLVGDEANDIDEGPTTSIRFQQSYIVSTSFVFS